MKKHAWLIPFAYGAMVLGAALYWAIAGTPFDKATYELAMGMSWEAMIESSNPKLPVLLSALVRELGGNFGLVSGVLIMAVAATAFRNGEKWAWWALWVLPLHSALDLYTVWRYDALSAKSFLWDMFLIGFALWGLYLPVRIFFPGKGQKENRS